MGGFEGDCFGVGGDNCLLVYVELSASKGIAFRMRRKGF